jgi:hypothetical protein
MTWQRTKPRAEKYGKGWASTRAAWAAQHHPSHLCTRCRQPLGPMGKRLHLDHNDITGQVDGFAHAHCNIRAGAQLGRQRQKTRRTVTALRM